MARVKDTRGTSDSSCGQPVKADLDRGVLPTEISPWLARALTALFLVTITSVPVVQIARELTTGRGIQALEVFTRRPVKENLHRYEKDLAQWSEARLLVQPQMQLALSRYLGVGNTNVVLGRDGWLFYRPGVELLLGQGLLDEGRLRLRKKDLAEQGEKNPNPDPRPAILALQEDCRKAGVHLVVVPVPDKAMLQPAELTGRLAFSAPVPVPANRDHARLLHALRTAGVDVFDPTPAQLEPGEAPRFLRQDTHWTPEWMLTVARSLAAHLRDRVSLPNAAARRFGVREAQVSRVGDIAEMLQLPTDKLLNAPQSVTIQQICDAHTGATWAPAANADVLLLGDSFSNIYCTDDLGWGTAAGFPAQLARFLGRDVDVLARNGSGATGTRRDLARRPNALEGKRVVIWQFAARDLAAENWEVVPLPARADRPKATTEPVRPGPVLLDGTVEAVSRVPTPFTVPYKDCLTYIKVRVVQVVEGNYADNYLIAVFWGMRDNVLLPAAQYAPGQRLRLKVVPLRQAPLNLQNVRSVDDLDDLERRPHFVLETQEASP